MLDERHVCFMLYQQQQGNSDDRKICQSNVCVQSELLNAGGSQVICHLSARQPSGNWKKTAAEWLMYIKLTQLTQGIKWSPSISHRMGVNVNNEKEMEGNAESCNGH